MSSPAEANDQNVEPQSEAVAHLERMLSLAKVDLSDVQPDWQQLVFDNPLLSDDFCLIQLDDHLVQQVKQGHSLVFRGEAESEPVLCSAERSYTLKEAEQSNSMLLLPDARTGDRLHNPVLPEITATQVCCMRGSYLETRERRVVPRAALTDLLQTAVYGGPLSAHNNTGLTVPELLSQLQMCDAELHACLEELPVCDFDGRYQWLEFDYRTSFLSDAIDAFDSEGGPDWRCFTAGQLTAAFNDDQRSAYAPVLNKLVRLFANPQPADGQYSLDEKRVCQFLAHVILRPTQRFSYDDFVKLWSDSAPAGIEPKLDYLNALALVDQDYRMKTVEYFPVEELPENVEKRFKVLFSRRARWRYDELQAYLTDVAASAKDVGSLITKFSRSTTVDGVRYYNAR